MPVACEHGSPIAGPQLNVGAGQGASEMAGTSLECPSNGIREIEKDIWWEGDDLFLEPSFLTVISYCSGY